MLISPAPMKVQLPRVVLSSFGRFHMFRTAHELARRASLEAMYTADLTAPPAELAAATHHFAPLLTILEKVAGRGRRLAKLAKTMWDMFDRWVAQALAGSSAELFQGYSLFCHESLTVARQRGMVTVVERAGSHILSQLEELRREAELPGLEAALRDSPYFQSATRMVEEYAAADCILTCSEYARRSFLAQGVEPHRVAAVPLGTNYAPTKRSLSDPAGFRVLCVGGDFYIKGIYYLLQAWRLAGLKGATLALRTSVPPAFAGLVRELGVEILPPLDSKGLAEEYAQASVFCLPSIDDAFGMVVLEAMAFGVPVVLSSHVGAVDLIEPGQEGLVFEARNIEQLAGCLTDLYRDGARRRWMGENARERVSGCSWETYGESLEGFYRDLCATKTRSSAVG